MLATDASILFIYFGGTSVPIWRACDIWNKEGKIPSFWGMLNGVWDQPQHGHLHNLQLAGTHTHTASQWDTCTQTPISFPFFPFFASIFALLFFPGRFRVPQMCHQTLVSIWTWGKKEILDRKVYKKRTLNFWHSLHSCFKMSRMARQGKATPSHFFFCLFAAFSSFPLSGRWRLAQGHNSFILIVQGHENKIGTAKLILGLFYSAKLKKHNPLFF